MAKDKDKKVQEQEESDEEFESYVDEEPIAPLSINKYDPFQLKGTVDDTIVALLEEKQFLEDNYAISLKILIGFGCIGITAAQNLIPYYSEDDQWKFPNNKVFLGVCVVIYMILMAGYYYVTMFIEKESFFKSQSNKVSKTQSHSLMTS